MGQRQRNRESTYSGYDDPFQPQRLQCIIHLSAPTTPSRDQDMQAQYVTAGRDSSPAQRMALVHHTNTRSRNMASVITLVERRNTFFVGIVVT